MRTVLILVAVLAVFCMTAVARAYTPSAQDADVDRDGEVTILDLSLVARHFRQSVDRNDVPGYIFPEVTVGNHELKSLGVYNPDACAQAVIFSSSSTVELSSTPTFDFLVAYSDDGVSPRGGIWQNIGNSSPEGLVGSWAMTRRLSANSTTSLFDDRAGHFDDEGAPHTLVGIFANQAAKVRAAVSCSPIPG